MRPLPSTTIASCWPGTLDRTARGFPALVIMNTLPIIALSITSPGLLRKSIIVIVSILPVRFNSSEILLTSYLAFVSSVSFSLTLDGSSKPRPLSCPERQEPLVVFSLLVVPIVGHFFVAVLAVFALPVAVINEIVILAVFRANSAGGRIGSKGASHATDSTREVYNRPDSVNLILSHAVASGGIIRVNGEGASLAANRTIKTFVLNRVVNVVAHGLDLRSQLFVGDAFPCDGINKRVQPEQGVTFHATSIQSEGELVNVSLSVFLADVMKDAVNTALENRPNRLDSVGIDRAACEVSRAVIDSRVTVEKSVKAAIARVFVAVDGRADFDVIEKALLNSAKVGTVQNKRLRIPAAFAHSENWSLAYRSASHVQLFVGVFVDLFAADECLIDFHDAAQFINILPTSLSESVKHEPCRLLGYTYLLRQLERTNAFSGSHYEVHGVNPFMERHMRPLEDGSSPNRESERSRSDLTGVAAVESGLAHRDPFAALALRADNAIRPQAAFQIEPGGLRIREPLEQLKRADSRFAHAPILANSTEAVKYIIPILKAATTIRTDFYAAANFRYLGRDFTVGAASET